MNVKTFQADSCLGENAELRTVLSQLQRAPMELIRPILDLGCSADGLAEDDHRIRLVNGMCMVVILMMSAFVIFDTFRGAWIEVIGDLVTILLFFVPLGLSYARRKVAAGMVTAVFALAGATLNLYLLGHTDLGIAIFFIAACSSCVIFSVRQRWLITGFIMVGFAGVFFFFGNDTPAFSPRAVLRPEEVRYLNMLAIAIFVVGIFLHGNIETTKFVRRFREALRINQLTMQQAQANARLASLGEFAAGVAHEINNPLAIIQGSAFILKRKAASGQVDPAELEKHLAKITETVERISKITVGMLAFARQPESGVASGEVDLKKLVDGIVVFFNDLARSHHVTAMVSGDMNPGLVTGQAGWVQQIIMNFLSNAKYAVLAAAKLPNAPEMLPIEIRVARRGDLVCVDIADWGTGISPEIESRLMEPFFTTKPVGSGTGLGLSISKGLAQSMGGDVSIESLKSPTIFRLSLRAMAEHPVPEPAKLIS